VASADYGTSTISGDNTFTAAAIASGGGGSSDSVGVSSQYGLPYTPGAGTNAVSGTPSATATITTTATSSLEAELNALLAELATLQARAGSSGSSLSHSVFTRNLSLGMTGNDVTELQLFLISEASGPATAKLKAHGTTKTFGILTFNALKEFQTKAGIKPAIGYFGPKTRAWVNTAEE
jgi:murein L,D-transpeptidase YcbB/YkuD